MGRGVSQSWIPVWGGIRPVISVARLGEQMGVQTKPFSNRVPPAASRSMWGVRITRLP